MAGKFFVSRKPPGHKKNSCRFSNFGRLKTYRTDPNPAPGTVNAHAEMRHETNGQRNKGKSEPDPPRPLPKMVIDKRSHNADDQAHAQPDGLAFQKKVRIAV